MNLATVADKRYFIPAVNLIASSFEFVAAKRAILCIFGEDMPRKWVDAVCAFYGPRIAICPVERLCDHAWRQGWFFFKAYALNAAIQEGEPFLYTDAASCITWPTEELETLLSERTRLFVQYPQIPAFENRNWTTRNCLKAMDCEEERYLAAHQYLGGVQAYLPTSENAAHIKEYLRLMQDPNVAGPDNTVECPDGSDGCRAHRNDQSVLSLLIERNGWHQHFDPEFFLKCGDPRTLEFLNVNDAIPDSFRDVQPVISVRYNRIDYLPKRLREDLL